MGLSAGHEVGAGEVHQHHTVTLSANFLPFGRLGPGERTPLVGRPIVLSQASPCATPRFYTRFKLLGALEAIFEAEAKETAGEDAGVDLWSESVEAAVRQLGVMATCAMSSIKHKTKKLGGLYSFPFPGEPAAHSRPSREVQIRVNQAGRGLPIAYAPTAGLKKGAMKLARWPGICRRRV